MMVAFVRVDERVCVCACECVLCRYSSGYDMWQDPHELSVPAHTGTGAGADSGAGEAGEAPGYDGLSASPLGGRSVTRTPDGDASVGAGDNGDDATLSEIKQQVRVACAWVRGRVGVCVWVWVCAP